MLPPAWQGTRPEQQCIGTAVDAELLLALAVVSETANPTLEVRIGALVVAGLAFTNFVLTVLYAGGWWRRVLRHLSRALGLALIAIANETEKGPTLAQQIVSAFVLGWFVLPPTSVAPP